MSLLSHFFDFRNIFRDRHLFDQIYREKKIPNGQNPPEKKKKSRTLLFGLVYTSKVEKQFTLCQKDLGTLTKPSNLIELARLIVSKITVRNNYKA